MRSQQSVKIPEWAGTKATTAAKAGVRAHSTEAEPEAAGQCRSLGTPRLPQEALAPPEVSAIIQHQCRPRKWLVAFPGMPASSQQQIAGLLVPVQPR